MDTPEKLADAKHDRLIASLWFVRDYPEGDELLSFEISKGWRVAHIHVVETDSVFNQTRESYRLVTLVDDRD